MRNPLAIALLLAGCVAASAQSMTPARPVGSEAASDAAWAPPSYGLATAGGAGATPIQSLGSGSGNPGTVVVTQPPVTPDPPKPTAVWKWAAKQVCVTTCNGYSCDANQWQTCEGSACPYPGRGCYAPWVPSVAAANGGFSVAPGTVADANSCYAMIYDPNPYYCYVGH